MGFLRVWGLFLLALLLIHLALSVGLRLRERRRLAEEWDLSGRAGDREAFLRAGMAAYGRSPRRRLLWLVVVLPVAGLALLLYVLNVA